jgi:hypothetical protein
MCKIPIMLTLCSIMHACPLYASFEQANADPRGIAMSGAMTAITGDAFGIFYNPASTAKTGKTEAGLAYTMPYGDADQGNVTGGVCIPVLPIDRNGALSAGVKRYRTDGYREQAILVGYARSVTSAIRVGISVSGLSVRMSGIEDETATGINVGLQAELKPGLVFGISSMNINSPGIGASKMPVPRTTLTGVSYRLATGTLLTVNAMTTPDGPGRLLAAGDIPVTGSLHMMVGMATNPSIISAGAGFGTGALQTTMAVSRDIDLGTTYSCGFAVAL